MRAQIFLAVCLGWFFAVLLNLPASAQFITPGNTSSSSDPNKPPERIKSAVKPKNEYNCENCESYYQESPKTSKEQRQKWEKKCKKRHGNDFIKVKDCFDKLQKSYLEEESTTVER